MQIYLLKDLAGKGKAGEIINVNDGYGKNYIIKNKIGLAVTPEIESRVRAKADSDAHKLKIEKDEITAIIKRLDDAQVIVRAKVGDGKLFGSITSGEVAKALSELGFEIEKRQIDLKEPIRALGEYKLTVNFAYGMKGQVIVQVVAA